MRKTLVYLLFFPPVGALAAITACGTHLPAVSARAELNQQRAAEAITARAEVTCSDPGPIKSLAEVVYCSAGGNLRRAGLPSEDAGIPCPKP